MSSAGGGQRAIVKKGDLKGDVPAGSVTFSPDGKQLAFTGINADAFYIVGTDGKGLRKIEGATFYNIDWSPDGTLFVAFAADKNGKLGLFTLNAEGQDLKLLQELPESDRALTLNARSYFARDIVAPRWSPDGAQIAFASSKNGSLTVYTINADGTELRQVLGSDTFPSYAPNWSSDASLLTFMADRDIQRGIYVVAVSGGLRTLRLISNVTSGGCPALQPQPTPTNP
jgi:Tol biopolymer transport system component